MMHSLRCSYRPGSVTIAVFLTEVCAARLVLAAHVVLYIASHSSSINGVGARSSGVQDIQSGILIPVQRAVIQVAGVVS